MTDVQGRTAFITGGANGIGLGVARRLARSGARLALADLDCDGLARAKAELEALTVVETFELDVRDRAGYARVADEVEAAVGPVSLLFNNAGVAAGASPASLSYDLWDWGIEVNLGGVINGLQTFLPRIVQRGEGGHIVNTASGAGLAYAYAGVVYTTAKYGVVGLSEALHLELKPVGVGVSLLCPGPVATGILERSAAASPTIALTRDQEQVAAERRAAASETLRNGGNADAVGQMVLQAVREDRLYIHTDRVMEDLIKARTKALLEAAPAQPVPTA